MHAENGPVIDVVAAELVAEGKTDPYYHGLARYPRLRGRGDQPGHPAGRGRRASRSTSSTSPSTDALDAVREARDRGAMAFAETCPQYLFLSLDDLGNGFEGAKFVCSPPLREKDPNWEELWNGLAGTTSRSSPRTTARSTSTARRSSAAATSARSPTACRASRTASTCCSTAASWAAGSARSAGSRSSRPSPRGCSGCTRARARSRSARTRTSWSTTRTGSARSAPRPTTWTCDYSCYEGRQVQGASDVVLSRGSVVVRRRRVHRPQGPRAVPQARHRGLRAAR